MSNPKTITKLTRMPLKYFPANAYAHHKKFSDKNLKISNFKPVDSKTKKPTFNFIQFSTIVFGQSIKQILKNVINVTTLHDNK